MTSYMREVQRYRDDGCEVYEDAWQNWPNDRSITGTGCVLYDFLRDGQKRPGMQPMEYALALKFDDVTGAWVIVGIIPKNMEYHFR